MGGVTDERVDSVLRDSSPAVVLTTSAVVRPIVGFVRLQGGESAPAVVAVDLLDLDAPTGSDAGHRGWPEHCVSAVHVRVDPDPGRVMVSNQNLVTNFGQLMGDLVADDGGASPRRTPPLCRGRPSITTWV